MLDTSSNAGWSPGTPPVAGGDFGECPILVLHYWASWDLLDREMDRRLAGLREEYAGRVYFRSCDVDRAENRSFVQGIANIPALGCFIRGKWHESLIGLCPEEELRSVLDGWLAAAVTPAGEVGRAKVPFFRKLLGLTVGAERRPVLRRRPPSQ